MLTMQFYYDPFASFTPYLFLLIWLAIGALLTIWVYNDAKGRRGMDPTLWAIVVLLCGPVGFIVYVAIRKPKRKR